MFRELCEAVFGEAYSRMPNEGGWRNWTKNAFEPTTRQKYADDYAEERKEKKKVEPPHFKKPFYRPTYQYADDHKEMYHKDTSKKSGTHGDHPDEFLSYKMMAWIMRGSFEEGKTSPSDALKSAKSHKDFMLDGKSAYIKLTSRDDGDYDAKFMPKKDIGFYSAMCTYRYKVRAKDAENYISWFIKH